MSLAAGTKLGPYEILASIGAGGMGEVYRARDSKLDREVAIKVLPEAWAQDPERLSRFAREAKALASLNHPNIAQIYGIQGQALVMELVAGETLKAPLSIETALSYARQIAEALEAAHEKGIVHRDLKPANVLVTPEGVIKVLDFGLAVVALAPAGEANISPTITMRATQAGMIMGTAAYMSPEQAAGKAVDKRSDIWSFGVTLWEMLTGERLFAGETISHTLAEVLRGPIDFEKLPMETPASIRDLLRRCLDRDVKNRLRDIGEARVAIGRALSGSRVGTEFPRVLKARPPWAWIAATAVSTLALLVTGLFLYDAGRGASSLPLIRLNAEIAPDTPLASPGNRLALSPDGTRLALVLRDVDGQVRLHTRLLSQSQITQLAGTDNAYDPFFSPDGEWIGFFANRKLKKISVGGGAAVSLCDAPAGRGASWGDDGNIVAALDSRSILSRVSSTGGTPLPVTKLGPGEFSHRWPQVLPGSQAILFTAGAHGGNYDDANIDVISLKTGERKTVERGGFYARYLVTSNPQGHLIYLNGRTLFAVPFDLSHLTPAGVRTPIVEDVNGNNIAGAEFAFASRRALTGILVYVAGQGEGRWPISRLSNSDEKQPLHALSGRYYAPRYSPDGKRLAFSMANGPGEDIWVKDLERGTPSRVSFLPGVNRYPVWTPDGNRIVFSSLNPTARGLYWVRSDGSGEAQRLTDGKLEEEPSSFSPDGKRLAFQQRGSNASTDIFTAPVENDPAKGVLGIRLGKAELFLGSPLFEGYPEFSPDGRWLAYQAAESGIMEVYVRPFPGSGGRWQISAGGGRYPRWSRDGRELYFETLDQHIMAASYTAKADMFTAGTPRVWAKTRLRDLAAFSNYDLAPDGKHIAAILADENASDQKGPTHLTFLLNFFDELRRQTPGTQ